MSITVTNYILKIGLLLGTSWLPGGTSWLVPRYMLHDTVTVMVCLVLSWRILGRPFHGVSRQWPVVVRYGMRRATGASLSSWFLKAAGLSCFQSPTVLAANELRSPDEDAPCPKFEPMIRPGFCYPQPLNQSGQDQRPHVQWRPYARAISCKHISLDKRARLPGSSVDKSTSNSRCLCSSCHLCVQVLMSYGSMHLFQERSEVHSHL